MSGIAGIFNFNQCPVEPMALQAMVATLQRRGPDGCDRWCAGEIGLGHTLLWNTPEARHERLPLITPRGNVITADARIDNRAELMQALRLEGAASPVITDSQLIVAAYEKWGTACPTRLVGDFAFAIWDRSQQLLFCARDHVGVKPFYYYLTGDSFSFASASSAIVAAHHERLRIHEGRIADYLVGLEDIDKTSTFYQEVFRLSPGHAMLVRREGVSKTCYWSATAPAELHLKSDQEYSEAFRAVFTQAIRQRLRSDTAPASMLSGGMDSSAIVGITRTIFQQEGRSPIRTFSAVSTDVDACLETQHIRAIADQGGIAPNIFTHEQVPNFANDLLNELQNLDEPFDSQMTLIRMANIAAHRQNIKVLLDGGDGDVTIADANFLVYLWRAGMWRTACSEIFCQTGLYGYYYQPWSLLYQSVRSACLPNWLRTLRRKFVSRQGRTETSQDSLISRDFIQRGNLAERLQKMQSQSNGNLPATLQAAHANAFHQSYLAVGLERYDRVAAAHAIEPRHPFLDKHVIEFCLALPWQQRTQQGWTKMILRRTLEPFLPPMVIWRTDKKHLGWSFTCTLLAQKKTFFHQLIHDNRQMLSQYLDMAALQKNCNAYFVHNQQASAEKIWEVASLVLWLLRQRSFFSHTTATQTAYS